MRNTKVQNSLKRFFYRRTGVFAVMAVSIFSAGFVQADEGDGRIDLSHWYAGGMAGLYKPDGDRSIGGGNTDTLGLGGGYQFNDHWSVDVDKQYNVGALGKYHTRVTDVNFTHYWGDSDKVRFLVDLGVTRVVYNAPGSSDPTTTGPHIGIGLSGYITDNLELRGEARLIQYPVGNFKDGLGLVSLYYHFKPERSIGQEVSHSALGDNSEPVAAPAPYREPAAVAPVAKKAVALECSSTTVLNYATNSTVIAAQNDSKLDQVANEIKGTHCKAEIEGHTDNKGTARGNKVLSLDRAIVVKRELKKRGVSSDKLHAVGKGQDQPVASNATKEGRAQNRRVEVKVYDSQP